MSCSTMVTPESSFLCRKPIPKGNRGSVEHIEETSVSEPTSTERYTKYPNRWSRIRELIKEPAAEFFGVMVLVIFGTGVNCQVGLSQNANVVSGPKGDYLSVAFGWAVGAALGVWVSSGISGGHINPAVTISFALLRDFPWRKVPIFIIAQLLGGICGAGIIYANYIHAIDIVEGGRNIRTVPGTAGLFGTYALPYMTNVSCFFEEFIGTLFLLLVVCAITDRKNGPPPPGLVPLVVFIAILGIGVALGLQTGFAINPARDFGPRLLTAMVGYGKEVFTYRNQYWLWCPIIAPILGGIVGTLVYDILFFTGAESPVNAPNKEAQEAHLTAERTERQRPIAGTDEAV
ncbi:aquaporin [Panus rudis PR-1116 ss-1]|nr:aquaporin [Panus rudis PR-1116 ss-1]